MPSDQAAMSVEQLTLDPTKPRKIAMSTTATCEVWSNYPTSDSRLLNGASSTDSQVDLRGAGDMPASKYCYRHRPDLKCRRQPDKPSMEELHEDLSHLPQADQQGVFNTWSFFSAASPVQRKLILQGILAQCCFPQLSVVAASIRELVKIDFLTALPDELALKILCFLDSTSICKAAQVSERWRKLADDDVVWHKMCEQHIDRKCVKCGWGLPLLDRKRLRTEKRPSQSRGSGVPERQALVRVAQDSPDEAVVASKERASLQAASLDRINGHGKRMVDSPEPDDPSSKRARRDSLAEVVASSRGDTAIQPRLQPWKAVYRDRFKIGYNWKHGRYTSKTFRGHENGVMCLQFDGNLLATGSYDTTIKLWDIDAGKEIRTLNGHSLGVRCLHFDDSKLISGALDGTVKVWDLKSGRLLRTLLGHKEGVISLHLDHHLLASGSMDKTIKVWNFNDPSTFVLRGHTDWVNSVKVDAASRTLFSASDDTTVRLWDLDSKTCFKIFKGHGGQVQSVLFLPPEFEYSNNEELSLGNEDHDHRGIVWTAASIAAAASGPNKPTVDPPLGPIPTFGVNRLEPPRYMLTGSLDSTIRLWDTHTGHTLRTFFGHLEGIWSLAADTLRIVSGGNDGMIKIWDPRTGKCERTFTNHTGPVTCVGLSDRRMFTGSEDHEVRMYNFSIPGEKYQDNH